MPLHPPTACVNHRGHRLAMSYYAAVDLCRGIREIAENQIQKSSNPAPSDCEVNTLGSALHGR